MYRCIIMWCTLINKYIICNIPFICSQAMVNVQMLSELEEIIQYKLVPERQEAIKVMWWERLKVRCSTTWLDLQLVTWPPVGDLTSSWWLDLQLVTSPPVGDFTSSWWLHLQLVTSPPVGDFTSSWWLHLQLVGKPLLFIDKNICYSDVTRSKQTRLKKNAI